MDVRRTGSDMADSVKSIGTHSVQQFEERYSVQDVASSSNHKKSKQESSLQKTLLFIAISNVKIFVGRLLSYHNT